MRSHSLPSLLAFCTLLGCQSPKTELLFSREDFIENSDYKLQLLIRDTSLYSYFSIEKEGVKTYASPENREAKELEFLLEWSKVGHFLYAYKSMDTRAFIEKYKGNAGIQKEWTKEALKTGKEGEGRLAGKRIALDPGHLGGSMEMAVLEDRFVRMMDGTDTLSFNEGNLALGTCLLLKEMLEREGAEVFLTREEFGHSAFDCTFFEWWEKNLASCLDSLEKLGSKKPEELAQFRNSKDSSLVFHKLFKNLDFERRTLEINAFQPDICFIVHYNAHFDEGDEFHQNGFVPSTEMNYNMAFVPGAFMKGELGSVENRVAFLRLLLGEELEKSIILSEALVKNLEKQLGVRSVSAQDRLYYLLHSCLPTGREGVYARNLSLTRTINSTLAYGESLVQNNLEEARKLNRKDFELKGVQLPNRIKQVAQAYFDAVLEYYGKNY